MNNILNVKTEIEINNLKAGIKKIKDIMNDCRREVEKHGESASYMLYLPGKWGKRNIKRLYKNGPKGTIISDGFDKFTGMVLVRFSAKEIADNLEKLIGVAAELSV